MEENSRPVCRAEKHQADVRASRRKAIIRDVEIFLINGSTIRIVRAGCKMILAVCFDLPAEQGGPAGRPERARNRHLSPLRFAVNARIYD